MQGALLILKRHVDSADKVKMHICGTAKVRGRASLSVMAGLVVPAIHADPQRRGLRLALNRYSHKR
jgi:hypothetical protein